MRGKEENKDTVTKPRPCNLKLTVKGAPQMLSMSASFDAIDLLAHPEDIIDVNKQLKLL